MTSNYIAQPYQILTEGNYYKFVTKDNNVYRIALTEVPKDFFNGFEHLHSCFKTFNLALITESEIKLGIQFDLRIGITICHLIENLLLQNPELVVFFIADNEDLKAEKRIRKFSRWYAGYKNFSEYDFNFEQFNFPMNNEFEGEIAYAGYILNNSCSIKHEVNKWKIDFCRSLNESKL